MERFALYSFAVLMVLGLWACGGSGGNVDSGQTPDVREQPDFQTYTPDTLDQSVAPDFVEDATPDFQFNPDLPDDPDSDTAEEPDSGLDLPVPTDVVYECTKDSDCDGKGYALAPCERLVCDKHAGECISGPRSPGESCDDEDKCTYETACTAQGFCIGKGLACDDANICTTDSCLPDEGCIHQPNDNICDDGNGCTKNDRCDAGKCGGEESESCACEQDEDCAGFEDGNLCNGTLKCVFGECKVATSTKVFCDTDDDSQCIKTVCVPDSGECEKITRENGRPCDDADACTIGDLCKGGICIGSAPRPCGDDNPCTNDTCDPVLGCLNEFSLYPCDDGDGCTVNDHCKAGVCVPGPSNECDSATCFPKWSIECGATDAWSTGLEGATKNVSSYPCAVGNWTGPEYTYAFVAPWDGTATVMLEADVVDMAIHVLESRQTGCDPVNCRGSTTGVYSFDMYQGNSYYFVVDGQGAGGQPFQLSLDCMPRSEVLCGDGNDEDQDGMTDCEDPDCKYSPDCPAATCLPIWTLACNATDFGSNYGLGSTDHVTTYNSMVENKGCLDNQWEYSGPEFAYRFDAPGDFNVSVKLTNETAQTDLLILKDSGNGCDPVECVAWGLKKVTFPAQAGETYYFVIDGYGGAAGAFNIEVTCPLFVETDCSDGQDNDLDAETDCDDSDCAKAVDCVGQCQPAKDIGCGGTDAFANFGWGATTAVSEYDCTQYVYTGPEIAYRFVAPYHTSVTAKLALETASTDILVLEGETCSPVTCIAYGLDTVTFPAEKGQTYNIVVDGWQAALGTYLMSLECLPESEIMCGDGEDNDQDGKVDCADEVDCNLSPACAKCSAVYPLACGDSDSWGTGEEESTDYVTAYSCTDAVYDGPEFSYTFEVEQTQEVTLSLAEEGWDLDLFVLMDNGYGCNPATCVAWGTSSVTFVAEKGINYYISVDGYGKALPGFGPDFGTGSYTITVECEQ